MSLGTALHDLRVAQVDLRQAVLELTMTVHEDRPLHSGVALIDNFAEVVSEFQGGVAAVGDALAAIPGSRQLPASMAAIDASVADSTMRYWRDLRAHDPLARLRLTVLDRGTEWRTWESSVEESLKRCEQPILVMSGTVQAAWCEVAELLCLYLPSGEPTSLTELPEQCSAIAIARPTSTRRPS
jgi:hypothetical protein